MRRRTTARRRATARRALATSVALLLALVLTACSSDSRPAIDQVKDSGVLKVGTEGTYPPFSYQDLDGNLTGYDVDVIRAVGDKLGVQVKFVKTPWDSIFAGLQAKRFQLVANQVTLSDERREKYDLSQVYTVSDGVIVTAADNDSIHSLADLKGKTTAQSATSSWADVAKDAGADVQSIEGFVQAIRLLKDGRVDATVNDGLAVAAYLKESHDTGVKVAATTGDTSKQVFVSPRGSGLMPEVDKALDELRADGTLAKISNKYFDTDATGPAN